MFHPKYILSWIGIGVTFIIAYVPWRIKLIITYVLSNIIWLVAYKRKRIVRINIALCLPHLSEQEQNKLAKDSIYDICLSLLETCAALWRCSNTNFLLNNFAISGLEYLKKAQHEGKAVLLVGGHFGSLDTALSLLLRFIYPKLTVHCTFQASGNKVWDWFIRWRRHQTHPAQHPERNNTRQIINILQRKGIIWMAVDQDPTGIKQKVFIPFMGVTAGTMTAPARLAANYNAVILPLSWQRIGTKQKYNLHISAPITVAPEIQKTMLSINQSIEKAIIHTPQQYWWVHKRFKTRPPGEAKVYV